MDVALNELIKMSRKETKKRVIQPKLKYGKTGSKAVQRNYHEEASFSRRLYIYQFTENNMRYCMISALRMSLEDLPRSVSRIDLVISYQLGAEVSLSALGTVNALIRKDGDYFVRAGFAYNIYKDGHLQYYENRVKYASDFFSEKLVSGEDLNQKQVVINAAFTKMLAAVANGAASPFVMELMGLLIPHVKQI